MDGRAAFASNAVTFVRKPPDDVTLFIRADRPDGKTDEAHFNLGNALHVSPQQLLVRYCCNNRRLKRSP